MTEKQVAGYIDNNNNNEKHNGDGNSHDDFDSHYKR